MKTEATFDSKTGHQVPSGANQGIDTRPWHVCVTKARQETYAVGRLREQRFQVYLPLLEDWVRSAGVWCKKQSVMFPRYVFVRPSDAGQAIGPARSTPGVTGLVRFGNVLASLSADRVEALRAVVASRSARLPDQPLAPGAQVVFSSGPLVGLEGIVSSIAAERVIVMMSLLGREKLVAVPVNDLAQA